MILKLLVLFALLAGVSNVSAVAEPTAGVADLIRQAEVEGLAHHPYWLALMHYKQSGKASEIISPEFFLSPRGATNSADELAATITAFFKEPNENQDAHAQCRFVARYQWLRKVLNWDGNLPPSITCKGFNDWFKNGHVDSLSLVFATGYLSNPASFYGHILLKFNTDRAVIENDLLDESINFGANVPSQENGVKYIIKGLFGGYEASFSNARFYQQNHMYAENELRDMWEYELALSKDEVDQIVAHSWEIMRVKFAYYFLKENCAYRMSELLELAIGQPLLPQSVPWAIPVTVFNRLESLQRDGKPIVRKVRLIPSRLNSYHANYAALTTAQKLLVKKIADGSLNFEQEAYVVLPDKEKIAITNTLLDYYEFRIVGDSKNMQFKKGKQINLMARGKLASENLSSIEDVTRAIKVSPPHEGSKPSMIRVSVLHNNQLGDGVELRFRPTYFDFLELDAGRIANSNLTMFDFRTVYAKNRIKLKSLDLVNIETLNVSPTTLPGDGGWAWKVKFGFENQDLSCGNCMTFNVTGGVGKTVSIANSVTAYGMIDFFGQTPYLNSGTLGTVTRIGLIGTPIEGWKSNFMLGEKSYINGSQSNGRVVRWENRLGTQRNWDVRISYEEQIARELQIGISTYW
jgi:hypothetical protein